MQLNSLVRTSMEECVMLQAIGNGMKDLALVSNSVSISNHLKNIKNPANWSDFFVRVNCVWFIILS